MKANHVEKKKKMVVVIKKKLMYSIGMLDLCILDNSLVVPGPSFLTIKVILMGIAYADSQ